MEEGTRVTVDGSGMDSVTANEKDNDMIFYITLNILSYI